MGFKSIERKREYNRLRLKNKREQKNNVVLVVPEEVVLVVPEEVVLVVPEEIPDPFIHDVKRFELLFDTIQMRELLSRKTRFNAWMSKQLDVLDEIKEYHK